MKDNRILGTWKMKGQVMKGWQIYLLVAVLAAGAVVMFGCKKDAPAPGNGEGGAAAVETEQKLCPVMGNPINPDIYTEYEGKKVYFCCPECKGKFEAAPEKYISKLPQFSEEHVH